MALREGSEPALRLDPSRRDRDSRPSDLAAGYRAAGRRGRLVRQALAVADLVGLVLAFAVAIAIFGSARSTTNDFSVLSELGLFAATLPGWLVLAELHGLYDRDEKHAGHTSVDDLIGVFTLVTVGSWLFYGSVWLTGFADPYPPKIFAFWGLAVCFVVAARVSARAYCRRRGAYVQNLIVVGTGEVGALLARKLQNHPEYGVRVLGFVEVDGDEEAVDDGELLGSVEELPQIVRAHGVERVLIVFPAAERSALVALSRELHDMQVQVDLVPRMFELVTPSATIHTIEGFPLISLYPARIGRVARGFKRGLDIVGALAGFVLVAPVFAWIALRIKLDSPGPVFYRHGRVGAHGRPFQLIKFRTMRVESSAGTEYGGSAAVEELRRLLENPERRAEFETSQKLANDPRVTHFGRFLRRLSLDELPQLVNVLLGDMSLVGPRPVTTAELARYGDEQKTLLTFRPGITGYWQINGRSRTDYEDRVRLDIAYVRGWSLKLDFLILGKTAWVLLTGHGAY